MKNIKPSMKFPKTINICGVWYKVLLVKDLRDKDDSKLDGNISYTSTTISIDKELEEQSAWQVFIHELVHGWFTVLHIEIENSENVVDSIASQIYCTLFSSDWT